MIPPTMKKPAWLVPACIAGLTIGIFLLLTVLTGFAPELRDRAARRGGTGFLLLVGTLNVVGPIVALWYHARRSELVDRGELEDEE